LDESIIISSSNGDYVEKTCYTPPQTEK